MDSSTDRNRGQALVEVTIVGVVILLLISAAISVTATLRAQLKHNFLAEPKSLEDLPEDFKELKGVLRIFPRTNKANLLERLEREGWQKNRNFKIPAGLITLLDSPFGHMGLINSKEGAIGVYYR